MSHVTFSLASFLLPIHMSFALSQLTFRSEKFRNISNMFKVACRKVLVLSSIIVVSSAYCVNFNRDYTLNYLAHFQLIALISPLLLERDKVL